MAAAKGETRMNIAIGREHHRGLSWAGDLDQRLQGPQLLML